MVTITQPLYTEKRIDVLDILRGIAIFGMIISHASLLGADPESKTDKLVYESVGLVIHEKFYTIFAILFGASFAIQFLKSEAKEENFTPRFLRRLLALVCFGIAAEVFTGFYVLAEYASAGLLLLLVRRWSTKMLLIAFFICCMATTIYNFTYSYIYVTKQGAEKYISHMTQKSNEARSVIELEGKVATYSAAMSARFKLIQYRYSDPINIFLRWMGGSILGNLAYFILGFLGIRLGIFEEPGKHRKLIILLMGIGIASWAASNWLWPLVYPPGVANFYPKIDFFKAILKSLVFGFGIVRDDWLAFIYIGAVLLLAFYNPARLKQFYFFRWCGRMALTNYILQAMLFSVLFYKYALSLPQPSQSYLPIISILIFGSLLLLSYWWLNRFRFGPLEWVWRSFTYWKWQPMKKKEILHYIN